MIVLTVRSLNGSASSMAPVQFDEMGGTIGRADSNQLVLQDQDRTISRLHAQVVYRSGRYALIDLGANAVLHNGQAIGHGREVTIQPGDELDIGGYKIAVSAVASVTKAYDPFAGFEGDVAAPPAAYQRPEPVLRPAPLAAPQPKLGSGIPDDWDPFQASGPGALVGLAPSAMPAPVALQGSEPSLDDLFGLGAPAAPAPAAPASRDDHASEMSVPWTEVFAVPKPAVAPAAAVVPVVAEAPVDAAVPLPADAQALMDAFVQGLGVDALRLRPVTPEAMLELGQMLREYTRGTMELLMARGALKKEVRADVTMMASHTNNVLKFSPTVEFALQHLLGTRSTGFMGSLQSVEDSFEDLKSHQLGVMAGMHAALQGVLKRFDPAEIEKKVGSQSGLLSLVPASRKAKLWELFQEMYGQSASQAREEFDDLFGKAFAREYDRFVSELAAKGAAQK